MRLVSRCFVVMRSVGFCFCNICKTICSHTCFTSLLENCYTSQMGTSAECMWAELLVMFNHVLRFGHGGIVMLVTDN